MIGELRKVRVPFAVNAAGAGRRVGVAGAHDEMRGRVDVVIAERRRLLAACVARVPVVPSEANFLWLAGARARRRARRVTASAPAWCCASFPDVGVRITVGTAEENDRLVGCSARDRRTRGRFDCRLVGDVAYGASATQRLTSSPMPSIAVRNDLARRQEDRWVHGGPTPPGVPVRIRSPGRSVTTLLT